MNPSLRKRYKRICLGVFTAIILWLILGSLWGRLVTPVTSREAAEADLHGHHHAKGHTPLTESGPRERLAAEKMANVTAKDQRDSACCIRGRVLDEAGLPIVAAKVTARRDEYAGALSLDSTRDQYAQVLNESETNSTGEFSLPVKAGLAVGLRVTHHQYAPVEASNCFGGTYRVLTMSTGATLAGRVQLRDSGEGVPGAKIRCWSKHGEQQLFSGVTDEVGAFRYDDLPSGPAVVDVGSPKGAASWTHVVLVSGETSDISILLDRGMTVRGRVTDAERGTPIPNADVGLGWTFRRAVRTDGNGEYVLENVLRRGVYSVCARAPSYARGEQRILPIADASSIIDFALTAGYRIRGSILDSDDRPIEGAYVATFGVGRSPDWISTNSNQGGEFELSGLRPGLAHVLLVQAREYGFVSYDLPIVTSPSEVYDCGRIHLTAAHTICGIVTGSNHHGVPNVSLRLRGEGDERGMLLSRQSSSVTSATASRPLGEASILQAMSRERFGSTRFSSTDDNGRFCFGSLPKGQYEIAVDDEGKVERATARVNVGPGLESIDIRIALEDGYSVNGVVLSARHVPVSDAGVRLSLISQGGQRDAYQHTLEGGQFSFSGVAAGEYVITVRPRRESDTYRETSVGYARVSCSIPTTDEVRIILPVAERISGNVYTARGDPIAQAFVTATSPEGQIVDSAFADSRGAFVLWVPNTSSVHVEARESHPDELSLEGVTPNMSLPAAAGMKDVMPGSVDIILQGR